MRGRNPAPVLAAALLALGLMLVVSARSALAEDQGNCPNGFFWERTSGQCCVQNRSTLPSHGKIGYTGNSLCEDGWFEVYDRRDTLDGNGPPGCPGYTSFVYLLECADSPEAAQKRQAEIDAGAGSAVPPALATTDRGGTGLNSLSNALFDSGGFPSPNDLALAGGAAGLLLATVGASALRGSGGAVRDRLTRDLLDQLKKNERAFEEAQRAADKAREEREKIGQQRREMEAAADNMGRQLDNLKAQMERFDADISFANKGKYTLFVLGLVAAIASLEAALPAAGAVALTGMDAFNLAVYKFVVAMETGGGGFLHGMMAGEWQRLKNAAAVTRVNAVFVREKLLQQIDTLNHDYDAANARFEAATGRVDDIRAEGARITRQISSK